MILKTLTLKNYRRFKDAVIEFPDGVIGVIGLNGVGKSTIFEAIAWALYGSVAARTSADQIKRTGAAPSDPCRVELEFIFEGDTYRIVREMSGKTLSPSATATVNSKLVAQGAGAVSTFIQKTLGMDFKSFFTSIFAKQKELNALSSMNASERRPLILRMLGIDSLDNVIKEINGDKKTKLLFVEKLSLSLIDSTGKNKIDVLTTKQQQLEKEKAIVKQELDEIQKIIDTVKKEIETLHKSYVAQRKKYETINQMYEKLVERKTLFERKQKLQEEIHTLQKKITERKQLIENHAKQLSRFQNLTTDLKKVNDRLKYLEKKTTEIIKHIEQKKTLIQQRDLLLNELLQKKKTIQQMGPDAPCPTCERVLHDQYHRLLHKYDEEIKTKTEEKTSFLKEIQKQQEIYNKYIREQNALEKKKEYLQQQQRQQEKIRTTIENLTKELTAEQKEYQEKQQQKEKIGEVRSDPNEYETFQKQMKTSYQQYQQSMNDLNAKKDQLRAIQVKLEKKYTQHKLIENEINTTRERIHELEKVKKQIAEEKKLVQQLTMLHEIMTSFRLHLISRVRPALSTYATDFFRDLTDGKYQEIGLDEQYNLLIYDGGQPYVINRFSGGEEDLANLCLRLAISEVITERAGGLFNLIILDEIFGSQDMIRQRNIMKALQGLSSKFRQIFLITHVEELKNSMQNIIYVYEEGEISKIELQ